MSDPVDDHETLTFVVRLWRETDACSHGHWRGRVEHIGTQEVRYVEDVAAVARFMERWTGEPDAAQTAHLADASCSRSEGKGGNR